MTLVLLAINRSDGLFGKISPCPLDKIDKYLIPSKGSGTFLKYPTSKGLCHMTFRHENFNFLFRKVITSYKDLIKYARDL